MLRQHLGEKKINIIFVNGICRHIRPSTLLIRSVWKVTLFNAFWRYSVFNQLRSTHPGTPYIFCTVENQKATKLSRGCGCVHG